MNNVTLRQTRKVTVNADRTVTISSTPGPWFPGLLTPPPGPQSAAGSPREGDAGLLVSPAVGLAGAVPILAAGDRLTTTDGTEWEALTPTVVQDRWATTSLLPVATLYPSRADLKEQGGTTVTANLPVALWPAGDRVIESRGEYQDFDGEAPPEHLAALEVKNRKLVIASRNLRVTSAVLDVDQPRVLLGLRRSNG